MSNILNELGVDEEDFVWQNLATCSGMENNLFFDTYEVDKNIAVNIDQACLSCPVISICYEQGVLNNEYGVWGGVYLVSGAVDKIRNSHKTKEVWNRLKKKHGI
jgi:hypothetical protein